MGRVLAFVLPWHSSACFVAPFPIWRLEIDGFDGSRAKDFRSRVSRGSRYT
jgi:hypothetical protein